MIKTGLLWYDNDPKRSLEDKVARALAHYRQKYGQPAQVVYVNPATLNDGAPTLPGVEVMTSKTVQPHHFWLGVKAGKHSGGLTP